MFRHRIALATVAIVCSSAVAMASEGLLAGPSGQEPAARDKTTRLPAHASLATSVSYDGVTFCFSGERPVGRYACGDWWVLAPVTITRITPPSMARSTDPRYVRKGEVRQYHGTQLDYITPAQCKGRTYHFDNIHGFFGFADPKRNSKTQFASHYENHLNVDPGKTGKPLVISKPITVIKSVYLPLSKRRNWRDTQNLIFLTVVKECPPEAAFRPSAEPGDKVSKWTTKDVDLSKLPRLPKPETVAMPNFAKRKDRQKRPQYNQTGRYDRTRHLMATRNQPNYGREHSSELGKALIALCYDVPPEQKRELAIAVVQQGLDILAMIKAGKRIKAADGNSNGRKGSAALAALLLNDEDLRKLQDGARNRISEDEHFRPVGDGHIKRHRDRGDRPRGPYTEGMRGVPEFNGQQDARSGSHWEMNYRGIVTYTTDLTVLPALLIPGMKAIWNDQPTFDYFDRAFAITRPHQERGRWFEHNGPRGYTYAHWKAWRTLSPHPVYKPRPEVMNSFVRDRRFGIYRAIGSPQLEARSGGFTAHLVQNRFRIQSYDKVVSYDLRYSTDGKTWVEVKCLKEEQFPYTVSGLTAGETYSVQTRRVHPEWGPGPWSFDWYWWKEGRVYEARTSVDGKIWTPVPGTRSAPGILFWLAQNRTKARHIQIQPIKTKAGKKYGWFTPQWFKPDRAFHVPSARFPHNTRVYPQVKVR